MTLFLIVAVVFVIVALIQKADKAALKEKNRRERETNIDLQKQIMLKWDRQVSAEIDLMPPITDYYKFYKDLYAKHDIPMYYYETMYSPNSIPNIKKHNEDVLRRCGDIISEIERHFNIVLTNSQKTKLNMNQYVDQLSSLPEWIQNHLHNTPMYDAFGRQKKDISVEEYEDWLKRLWTSPPTYFKDIIHMFISIPRCGAGTTPEELKKYPKEIYVNDGKDRVFYTLLKNDENCLIQYFYYNLIWDLTKRDMYNEGFQMSRENQDELITRMLKDHDRQEEYRKKYPWE